ncbi:FecR domain-containing protein [Niastella sp. OAS944]|uniref:FecR domain-containing protein n=1 Tax=Niastella sp. OAS944 TaxID=2664089 RepID=UPI003488936D|nr:ferric-dicitrate binding protein FerR (iron transport regulator) [Chitinophagaceae bacterium OAS944]
MSTQNNRLQYLVQQYLNDKSTAEELEEFWQQVSQLKDETVIQAELDAYWAHSAAGNKVPAVGWEQVLQQVYSKAEPYMQQPVAIPLWRKPLFRWAAAAVVILSLGVASWWLLNNNKTVSTPGDVATTTIQDVPAPHNNRATITLNNGQTVYLDSAGNGALASEGSVQVVKLADGQIAYKGAAAELIYNTLTNPRGSRVIDMTLSDGSRIWLNAGSSITYPVAFVGNDRKVEVKGEVYFEVAHDAAKPFKVQHGPMNVEVLGTHFNVNVYEDEPDIKVTLLEGSVKVVNRSRPGTGAIGNNTVVLTPGKQAVFIADSRFTIADADVEQVMAWKNGLFSFTGADLATVMRQLSRWYNVDVKYEGQIPARKFSGEITHDLTLSQLMNGLQSLGIKFNIQGRTMIVQQK